MVRVGWSGALVASEASGGAGKGAFAAIACALALFGCRGSQPQPGSPTERGGTASSSSSASVAVAVAPPVPTGPFRITPVRPIDEIRREALAAQPPEEPDLLKSDLVELRTLEPGIRLDIRYATTNNFLGTKMYDEPRAFMQRPAAESVVRVHRSLSSAGYGLLIHDAYRPWYVTKMFWEATPADKHTFVANPAHGSRHNRGCAVDLTLFELKTGKVVEMPSDYDELSDRARAAYPGGTAEQRRTRDLLRAAMEAEGFAVYDVEWWHFDYKNWKRYPLGNATFDKITGLPLPLTSSGTSSPDSPAARSHDP